MQKLDASPHSVTSDQAQEEPWRRMFANWLANWLMLTWLSYTVQVHLPGNGATCCELYLLTAISNQDTLHRCTLRANLTQTISLLRLPPQAILGCEK